MTGVNCQADSCCTEFISTKLQYGKDGGRMYYHFVQSFHPEEAVTPELALRIALELAQQWKGYEVLVATHTDRAHIHSHFIVNSVSFQSGNRCCRICLCQRSTERLDVLAQHRACHLEVRL